MSSHDPKIITTLQQRHQIEQALKALGETASEEELARLATEIAQHGEAVVPALLALLGTSNLQLRGGLGHVAQRLPRELIVPALRAAAGNPARPDNERMTAMTILERYLNEPLGPELFQGLTDPRRMALASLREALAEFQRDPDVVMEYLTQLEKEPTEVALMIIEATTQVEPAEVVTLLRMLALDPRQPIAQAALRQLGSIRLPTAAVALQSLVPNLPDPLKPLAERGLRKLALTGIPITASESSTWRTLISPVGGDGDQLVLFSRPHRTESTSQVISLWLSDQEGIQDILVAVIPSEQLPAANPIGHIHLVRAPQQGAATLLLEAPFDLGRAMLADAVALHWTQGRPLPMAYRLHGLALWESPWSWPPEEPPEPEGEPWSPARALELMKHPAFYTWGVHEAWMYEMAMRFRQAGQREHNHLVRQIAARAFTEPALRTLTDRLRRMGRWLFWAQELELARLAMWTAAHLQDEPPSSHPLLLYLADRGLQAVLRDLARGKGSRRPDSV